MMLPSLLGWLGGNGGSLLPASFPWGMLELWFYGVVRAELWSCLHGVLAPSGKLPQGHSLLSSEAGLAGSGQCLVLFPMFPPSARFDREP